MYFIDYFDLLYFISKVLLSLNIKIKQIEIMNLLELLKSKLQTRNTQQLKNDIKEAMVKEDETSIFVFSVGLSILESRLSKEDYEKFENEL